MPEQDIIKSAFNGPGDEFNGSGKRPVVFDVYDPSRTYSILPDDLKMVLHVNPSSMKWSYTNHIERTQTLGGWVEAHWGQAPTEVNFEASSGGFVRLYSGLSNITGPTPSSDVITPKNMLPASVGGTRRDTIAYDKYLDLLALFYFNGAIYDENGNIALQGQIRITYDGGSWWGWFTDFDVTEAADKPYQFTLTTNFIVEREQHTLRGVPQPEPQAPSDGGVASTDRPGGRSNPTPTAPTVTRTTTDPTNHSDPAWQSSHSDALDTELSQSLNDIQAATPPQPQPGHPTPRRNR